MSIKSFFSNGLVQLIIIILVIYIIFYYAAVYGQRGQFENVTADGFDLKITDGYKTLANKHTNWGDSWSEHIGKTEYSMKSNAADKTFILNQKWDSGETSWMKYDYINGKTTSGQGNL